MCFGPKPELYIERLSNLRPLFLSLEGSRTLSNQGSVELREIDPAAEVIWHKERVSALEVTFLRSLFPLLKISGGLVEVEKEQILEDYIRSMRTAVGQSLSDIGPVFRFIFRIFFTLKLWRAERTIRRNFAAIDFISESLRVQYIRKKVEGLGRISQIPPEEVVDAVLNQLDESDRKSFSDQFPRNFAKGKLDRANDVAAFAFTMFTLGAVPGGGKVLRSSMDTKKQPYRAQFLDCLHIGEASHFDLFVTCDAGAHRLASVVYAFAGLSTRAVKLEV